MTRNSGKELCTVCSVEQTTAEQARRNKRETIIFR